MGTMSETVLLLFRLLCTDWKQITICKQKRKKKKKKSEIEALTYDDDFTPFPSFCILFIFGNFHPIKTTRCKKQTMSAVRAHFSFHTYWIDAILGFLYCLFVHEKKKPLQDDIGRKHNIVSLLKSKWLKRIGIIRKTGQNRSNLNNKT